MMPIWRRNGKDWICSPKSEARKIRRGRGGEGRAKLEAGGGRERASLFWNCTAANKTVRRKARLRRWAQRSKRRSHKPASQLHSHGHDGGGMKRDSSLHAGYQRKTISVPCAYACLCTCVRGGAQIIKWLEIRPQQKFESPKIGGVWSSQSHMNHKLLYNTWFWGIKPL